MSQPGNAHVERKLQLGTCMRCPATGLPEDQALCDRCSKRERKRKRLSERRGRARRRARGRCAFCETRSATYRCPTHAIKHAKIPTLGTAAGVAHEVGDQWRRDGNGWERFRGKGKRGAPTAASNDEADLVEAFKALEKGRKALAYARSAEVEKLGTIQRKSALAAATSLLAMAGRFVLDVARRNVADEDAAYAAECRAADAELEQEVALERAAAMARKRAAKPTVGTAGGVAHDGGAFRPRGAAASP